MVTSNGNKAPPFCASALWKRSILPLKSCFCSGLSGPSATGAARPSIKQSRLLNCVGRAELALGHCKGKKVRFAKAAGWPRGVQLSSGHWQCKREATGRKREKIKKSMTISLAGRKKVGRSLSSGVMDIARKCYFPPNYFPPPKLSRAKVSLSGRSRRTQCVPAFPRCAQA